MDMTGALIGRGDSLFLHIEGRLLIAIEFMLVPPKQIFSNDIEILPTGKIQMTLQRAIVVEDKDPLCRIIQIDEAVAIADRSRIRYGVEQLAKVGCLITQGSII